MPLRQFLKAATLIAGLLCAGVLPAATLLDTQPVALAQNLKPGDRVGRLRFLGMLELPDVTRNGQRLSQLSGLAWDEDEGILYALSDKGGLFHLQPEFDGERLAGVRLLRAVPLRAPGTDRILSGWRIDAEALDIVNGRNGRRGDAELVIGMEREPEIVRYRPDGYAVGRITLPSPVNKAGSYSGSNKMLEALCMDPGLGPLTMPEVPLKNERRGYNRIFSLSGVSWLYPAAPGERFTALECLGDGEAIVLRQNFQHPFGRTRVMLQRVRLTADDAGGKLKPETLVSLDSEQGFLIDNFEGLARHQGRRFFMVSDNNNLFVQRSLLMYFELLDDR